MEILSGLYLADLFLAAVPLEVDFVRELSLKSSATRKLI